MKPFKCSELSTDMLLLEWPEAVSEALLQHIASIQSAIETSLSEFVLECYPAYCSLGVCYDPEQISAEALTSQIRNIRFQEKSTSADSLWRLPVCYDPALAPDLLSFAEQKKMSAEEVAAMHAATDYLVHFYGFLPGFMYLGGLASALHLARKSVPARSIPQGAVAIGGQQTGIYPQASPGGWHVIGICPLLFFDASQLPPCRIMPGDRVRFAPISSAELLMMRESQMPLYPEKILHG